MAHSPTSSNLDGDAGGVAPVFVGGAPRSGTHIVAHLIGAHPSYSVIPYEVVVHCGRRRGIPAFVNGIVDRDELIETIRTHWWRRPLPWRPELDRGLYKLVGRQELDSVLEQFRELADDDRLESGRWLARSLFAAITAGSGAPGFSEHTPENLNVAPDVLAIFPEAKIVHVVRDGRDRACSVVKLPFGADTYAEAMRRWALVLKRGERVRAEIPPDRLLVLQLEDLVLTDRDRSYARLLEFIELPDDPAMRAFFESEVGPERAHVGRWRTELEPAERAELEAAYAETVTELRADGVTSLPPERPLEVAYGVTDGTSSVDPWVEGRGDEDI
jgi:Sulfotransferase family